MNMDGVLSKETHMSLAASSMFPGFRFSPTDIELISYYLKKKLEGCEKHVEVISEVDICRYEPWDLPAKSIMQSDNEWFFFAARGKKYPNGSQSRRATELGYWKATGKERNVKSGLEVIGTKRTLVFHIGRAPKGERTEWIMHEYCKNGAPQDSLVVCRLRKNIEFRLNNSSNRANSSRANSSQGDSQTGNPTSEVMRDLVGLSDGHMADGDKADGHMEDGDKADGDKAVDGDPKKSSSSYDSHSIELFDSASDSSQQAAKDIPLVDSCSLQEDFDGEEDCYADILKDDIINLEDSLVSATHNLLPAVANKSDVTRKYSQQAQAVPRQPFPFQGSAHRRIRLNRSSPPPPGKETHLVKTSSDDYNTKAAKESPRRLDDKSVKQHHLLAVVFVLAFLMIIYFMLSNLPLVKRIRHSTLYNNLIG